MAFDRSKREKKHARKVIEYEKFLGVEESLCTLILQAVEGPYLEALKEYFIGYGGRTPFEMILHLHIKISKAMNKDKVQLKQEVFIMWEQPQVLSVYFKQIEKERKQLAKWSVKVSDNDIIIHVVNQIYESDWFSEEAMTKWEETNDNSKTWTQRQQFFQEA